MIVTHFFMVILYTVSEIWTFQTDGPPLVPKIHQIGVTTRAGTKLRMLRRLSKLRIIKISFKAL